MHQRSRDRLRAAERAGARAGAARGFGAVATAACSLV